jgi:hypothetical protein
MPREIGKDDHLNQLSVWDFAILLVIVNKLTMVLSDNISWPIHIVVVFLFRNRLHQNAQCPTFIRVRQCLLLKFTTTAS